MSHLFAFRLDSPTGMARLVFLFLCLVSSVTARLDKYDRLKETLERLYQNETWRELVTNELHEYEAMYKNRQSRAAAIPFNCFHGYTVDTSEPTSVHALRPEHIKVIAAMGDSLTAGNGILAWNIFQALTEYRGRAWSIGGDQNTDLNTLTLPNFFKKYNSNIRGFSVGHCAVDRSCAHLNVAEPGNVASDMPRQAQNLVDKMKVEPNVDYVNDWKVVTLFIGGNDLCDYCNDRDKYSSTNYYRHIKDALDILYYQMPRVFVNLVEIFDITPLARVANGALIADVVTNLVCDCGKDESPLNVAELQMTSLNYQAEVNKLVDSGRYDTKDDFTVVVQPFFRNTEPPKDDGGAYDISYFCPDRFHFSEKGTNEAGKSLWNNMLEPVGQKSVQWFTKRDFLCPGVNGRSPYLRTKFN